MTNTETDTYAADVAALDREIAAAQKAARLATAKATALAQRRGRLDAGRLSQFTDEQLLADEALLSWLVRGCTASSAYDRARPLLEMGRIHSIGIDSGPGKGRGLPAGCIVLLVETLPEAEQLAADVRAWAARWALGREFVPFKALGCDLGGIVELTYQPSTDTAILVIVNGGRRKTLAEAELGAVLAELLTQERAARADASSSADEYDGDAGCDCCC